MEKRQLEQDVLHAETKEALLAWADQFENNHYVFDVYGEPVTVYLPRDTVEKVMDISLLLLDRVVAAHGEITTAEYLELEENVRGKCLDDGEWILHIVMKAAGNNHLFGRYKDIEPMIGKLNPRGYPMGTVAYLMLVRPEIHKLIYAVIRHADDAREHYESLAYTFFIGILAKCWGTGYGWSKTEKDNWVWSSTKKGRETDSQ